MSQDTLLSFKVDGLSCGACAARAQQAIGAVPGVQGANVSIANHTASARITGAESARLIEQALTKAGKPAVPHKIELEIEGMHCGSCVGRAETALEHLPGVLRASVNLASARALVETLSADPAPLLLALRNVGLTGKLHDAGAPQTDEHADQARALGRMTLWAMALTLPVFVLEMGGHMVPAFHHLIARTLGTQQSWMIQFVLTLLVLIGPGRQFFALGIPALLRRAPDMNALVALGTASAFGFSTVTLLFPEILPPDARAVYFEAAAVIVTLILLGRFLEARAKGRTSAAIRKLAGLRPETAMVEREGTRIELPLAQIEIGDVIHLRPGERVAVDGTVTQGDTWIDESMISGEPVPAAKHPGAQVIAGTLNGTGSIQYCATAVGRDTMLARIIAMVEEAQAAKLPIQELVNKVTLWFVPAVLVAAALTVALWFLFGPAPAITHALVAGVSVLIIACPCAMGLATPTSIMVGTGRAAELGVLFRKGDALQRLQSIRTVAFDKTGTLTQGHPALTDVHLVPGQTEDAVLALVASVERASEHPIAKAICDEAEKRGLHLPAHSAFQSLTGLGILAKIDGQTITVGTQRLMAQNDIDHSPLATALSRCTQDGKTPVLVALDGQIAGLLAVSDPIKPEAAQTVKTLQDQGLHVVMITGDNAQAAQAVANQLGIQQVVAEVLPGGKRDAIADLSKHAPVAFVGDGINDAPALASADIGIAIGSGTDIAIEAADVVLVSGTTSGVATALTISRATMRNIKQNLFWAFGYNIVLIPVAAGALYPAFGLLLSPALAAGAMALSSVFVLSNALRLRFVPAEG